MALTAQGKVIVWGKIGGPGGTHGGLRGGQPGPMVAELMGLPPIVSIAAGQSHALMTDGERVWALGRSVQPRCHYLTFTLFPVGGKSSLPQPNQCVYHMFFLVSFGGALNSKALPRRIWDVKTSEWPLNRPC